MPAPPGTQERPVQHLPRSLVPDLHADEVAFAAPARHHLERVLRVRAGEALELVDGRGGRARARWTAAGRARIEERFPTQPPTRDPLVLAVAPPRLPRLEWLVEKASELDVSELQLLDTRRAERLPGEGRLERLQRIADQALEQCGRLHRMPVHAPVALGALLARPRAGELWLAHPPRVAPTAPDRGAADATDATDAVDAVAATAAPIGSTTLRRQPGLLVLIGPEGGFDPDEEAVALAAGARAVALGATTLRVETAALALAVLARARAPAV